MQQNVNPATEDHQWTLERSARACYWFGLWWIQSGIWQHAIVVLVELLVSYFVSDTFQGERMPVLHQTFCSKDWRFSVKLCANICGLCHLHVVQFQPCANRMISNEISIRFLARWWASANHAGVWWSNGYQKASMRCGQYAPNVALYIIKTPKW